MRAGSKDCFMDFECRIKADKVLCSIGKTIAFFLQNKSASNVIIVI